MKFKPGQRVILKGYPRGSEDFPDGMPEERGVIEDFEGRGMYIVLVDDRYRDGEDDDGLREVHADQIEAEGKSPAKKVVETLIESGTLLIPPCEVVIPNSVLVDCPPPVRDEDGNEIDSDSVGQPVLFIPAARTTRDNLRAFVLNHIAPYVDQTDAVGVKLSGVRDTASGSTITLDLRYSTNSDEIFHEELTEGAFEQYRIAKGESPYAEGYDVPGNPDKVDVYEFPDKETMQGFLSDIGGAPHPLGGLRVVLAR